MIGKKKKKEKNRLASEVLHCCKPASFSLLSSPFPHTPTQEPPLLSLSTSTKMTDPAVPEAEEELVDYEEEEAGADDKNAVAAAAGGAAAGGAAAGKGAGYVGIHSSGFKDFLLKPELLRAIVDCGFEHPSEGKKKGRKGCNHRRCCFFPPTTTPARFFAYHRARFRIDALPLEVSRPR